LAFIAQDWSDRCVYRHGQGINSSTLQQLGIGQNIYASYGMAMNVIGGVTSWFNEKTDYTLSSNTCAAGKVCGHYTQVILFAF
jgi:pathogenesis-related protein 1